MTEFGPEYWKHINGPHEVPASSASQDLPTTFQVHSSLSISVFRARSTESMTSASFYAELFAKAVEGEIRVWSAESLRPHNQTQTELEKVQQGRFNIFSPEAEEYLNNNPTAKVIVAVEAKNRPLITDSMTEEETIKALREAGKKDTEDLIETLTAAQQKDKTILFWPRFGDSSLGVKASSTLIRSLAQRPDVTEIYMPLPKKDKNS